MKSKYGISKKCRRNLMKKSNVVGVGFGYREKSGVLTEEEAVVVYVTQKKPRVQLNSADMVPRSLQGRTVDVIEIGEVRLLEGEEEGSAREPGGSLDYSERISRHRPAPCGVSIAHFKVSAGTFGAVVYDQKDGRRLILSNNHVLANSTSGIDNLASPGDPILQPASYDGGTVEADLIAHLDRFIPLSRPRQRSSCVAARYWERLANRALSFSMPHYRVRLERLNSRGNLVDAAIARPVNERDLTGETPGLGAVSGSGAASLGDEVFFCGRTSGVVSGKIIALEVDLYVSLGNGEQVLFEDQLIVSAVSRPGDSGSLLIDESSRAVGLLFAGSESVAVCNRIDHVCCLLEISFGD